MGEEDTAPRVSCVIKRTPLRPRRPVDRPYGAGNARDKRARERRGLFPPRPAPRTPPREPTPRPDDGARMEGERARTHRGARALRGSLPPPPAPGRSLGP